MPTRREMDRMSARLDALDQGGTRGVAALQVQVADLAKDVAEIKGEAHAWQTAHVTQHERESHDRVTGRRWLIGTGIAGLAAMSAAIGLLVDIAAHIHP